MAGVTQLGYLGINVSDLDAWEQFATDVLGLQVSGRDTDGSLFLKMDEYHHRFNTPSRCRRRSGLRRMAGNRRAGPSRDG